MASLSSQPALNPELKTFFSGLFSRVKSTAAPASIVPIVIFVVLIGVGIGLLSYYFTSNRALETPVNIKRLTKEATMAASRYDFSNPKRAGLRSYLTQLKKEGVPDAQLVLGNFYISTANAAGVFLPGSDAAVSPMAARAAVLGGARGFVFDIWPDLSPGANFAPILQVVEPGSSWRRISINSLSFLTALRTLINEAFEVEARPGNSDPIVLYLRFRGKPRAATYTATANALRTTLEQYRLESAFNNCRNQDRVFSIPMTNLFKKVVIVSNVRAEGNALSDYINVGPRDGLKLEMSPAEIRGLSAEGKADAINKIRQNLTIIAPLSEETLANDNYAFDDAMAVGVHMCALNFMNDNDILKKYMGPTLFGTQSFKIKPSNLRYSIEVLPKPKYPENPNWGTGAAAGSPTMPPPIKLPI